MSDESRFTLLQSDGGIKARTEADKVMHPSCLSPTAPTGRWLQLLWSRSSIFKSMIRFIPSSDYSFPGVTDIFQDDNTRMHRVHILKRWFREPETSFSHVAWPPQSVTPFENLGDVLEKALYPTLPSSIQDLGEKL